MPTPLYEQLKKVRAVFLSSMDREEKANEVTLFKQMKKYVIADFANNANQRFFEEQERTRIAQELEDERTRTANTAILFGMLAIVAIAVNAWLNTL